MGKEIKDWESVGDKISDREKKATKKAGVPAEIEEQTEPEEEVVEPEQVEINSEPAGTLMVLSLICGCSNEMPIAQ
ncbi:hypothetical protein FRX31_032147 [Thalictrum thalictroides]|uniref:Uncharacterized protein n=1 Tax=Thalictrum thalictroides TaxID=46969 RepID=A0A7J6V279_THATH|nr:hypothetical protein FRX31_032147 [Thalictrum thalictroides]